ncbi:MAG: penicillin-binding protein 2 [Candidatus Pacebacteria bacterium]|nr:penicillin-binding protein 2 [Candidatus Paceibacterota bacterium]
MFKRKDKSFAFDEIVADTVGHRRFGSMEKPIDRSVFNLVSFLVFVLILIVSSRIFFINVVKGGFYQKRAVSNVNREIKTPAPRGLIFDRFGNPLVENEPTFSVVLNLIPFFKNPEIQEETISKLSESISSFEPSKVKEKLFSLDLEKNAELIVAKNISLDEALTVKSFKLESVSVVDDYRRHYLNGAAFGHVLGYTGEANLEELQKNNYLDFGDEIGKIGLELFYDKKLTGQKGTIIDYRDAKGDVIEKKKVNNPVPGEALTLTIDSEFQNFFFRRMLTHLDALGRDSGVGLAFDPRNGEILAALSFPYFDSNIFISDANSESRTKLLNSLNRPLFNRFVSGVYNPGSTIKPLVAIAALNENVVTPEKVFYSPGYLDVPNPYHPESPSRFVDWKPQGWVDLYSSLARSSNVYYYYVGGGFGDFEGLGISRLIKWWKTFGLAEKTGIDLPGEKVGVIPDPDEREERIGEPWRVGDTYNVTIGQGDLAVTPLELLNYISVIANDGISYVPHFLKSEDKKILLDLSYLKKEISMVQKGMEDTVSKSYGTANILNDLPFEVAAKTGSAQVENKKKTNAFFVAYAPAENPEIAILILVEDAREGSLNAVPIGKEILYWYYTNRLNQKTAE